MMVWTMSVCLCPSMMRYYTFRNVLVNEIRDLDWAKQKGIATCAAVKCWMNFTLGDAKLYDNFLTLSTQMTWVLMKITIKGIPAREKNLSVHFVFQEVVNRIQRKIHSCTFLFTTRWFESCAQHWCTIHWWWSMHYSNNLHNIAIGTRGCLLFTLRHAKCLSLLCMHEHRTHCIPAKQWWYGFTLPNRDRFSGVGVQIRCDFFPTSISTTFFNRAYFTFSFFFFFFSCLWEMYWWNTKLMISE